MRKLAENDKRRAVNKYQPSLKNPKLFMHP